MSQPNLNDADRASVEEQIQKHEDNLKFFNSLSNSHTETILDLQVRLGKYHSASVVTSESGNGASQTEEEAVEQILKKENSAAGIFCWLKANAQTSNLALAKDALGVVATLGRVESDDISRILSEYLGLENMLGIVCNTYEGVNAPEKYNPDGTINSAGGLHGIGSSIGRIIKGRFVVICLENLSSYPGNIVANDPQKKLDIRKPGFPNESPPGFLDYAVNMIHLDPKNLSFVTSRGYGLRETLFYHLFSLLQVYKTRSEMLNAMPFIREGAVSLDGGIIRKNGIFDLGSRKEVEVKFGVISGESAVSPNYIQIEEELRKLKWEASKLADDIKREQQRLDHLKRNNSNA